MPYDSYMLEVKDRALGKTANSRGWVRVECPACPDRVGKDDRSKPCGFNTITGGVNCFRCGLSGYVDGYGTGPIESQSVSDEVEECPRPPGYMALTVQSFYTGAQSYLTGRGVPAGLWKPLEIGVCDKDTFASQDESEVRYAAQLHGRIIVPVRNLDGKWRGFVGRAYYTNPRLPYRNHPGPWRDGTMWNVASLAVDTEVPVLVTEGLFDALPLYPNSVALLGKPTEKQVGLLLQARRPVCMCLDGDAWRLSRAVALKLHLLGQHVGFVKLPPGKDPNDLSPDYLFRAAQESVASQSWRN